MPVAVSTYFSSKRGDNLHLTYYLVPTGCSVLTHFTYLPIVVLKTPSAGYTSGGRFLATQLKKCFHLSIKKKIIRICRFYEVGGLFPQSVFFGEKWY